MLVSIIIPCFNEETVIRETRRQLSSILSHDHSLEYEFNMLSEIPLPIDAGDLRVVERKIINSFNALGENNKYIRGLMSWIGFKQIGSLFDEVKKRPEYIVAEENFESSR